MTLVIMTVFMIDPSMIGLGYVISIFASVMMYFLFRSSAPRERVVYIGKYPPKLYTAMKWSIVTVVPVSAVLALLFYRSMGPAYAFIVGGVGVIVPGVFGYLLERRVAQIDKNYPTFLKALGENLASTSDLKTALSFILYMELGPLRELVRAALARVKLGLDHRQALEALSVESASFQVHMSNKILLDSLNRGGNPLVIGNALGNRVVKFLEFTKMRDVVANSFQMIVLVVQPLTVVLLGVLEVLAIFMSQYLTNLPYFGFHAMPIGLIQLGNVIVIFVMAIVNALTVKAVSGGYWGTFFFNLGILLIISGAAWIGAHYLMQVALSSMPSLQMPSAI
jgi:archaellum biogenesis protein FlaJ (TadC family)